MPELDLHKLIHDVDPAFRSREADQFAALMKEAEAAAERIIEARVAQYDKAIRLLAAAVYVIARDLEMMPNDMSVVATYTVGLFTGASCQDNAETLRQLKKLFASSLEDANADKGKAAAFMAEIVGDGIDMIRNIRPPSGEGQAKP